MAGAEKQRMERQGHPLGVRIPNAWESEKIRPRRTLSGGGVANNDPIDGVDTIHHVDGGMVAINIPALTDGGRCCRHPLFFKIVVDFFPNYDMIINARR